MPNQREGSHAGFDLLIAEDDQILKDFLEQEAQAHCQNRSVAVRSVSSISEGMRALKQRVPDCLLLDIQLPDGPGFELAIEFIQLNSQGRILILTGQADHHPIPQLLHPYLEAVLRKADGLDPLRNALWSLRHSTSPERGDIRRLSPRQLEILRLIGKGYDTAEIAKLLGITLTTAQTHRRQITSRLGIRGIDLITIARSLPRND
jgi:DNA-binding NarL/FixJ family response regulator